MTFKLVFTILLATLGSVLGSECDEVDSLPIQPNCTVKRYWAMYCEVNGQQFTLNNVSVPPGLLSTSTDQPQPTRCENATTTVTDTTTATETATATKTRTQGVKVTHTATTTITSTSVATSTSIVSSFFTSTVTTTATITSTAVTSSTSIVSAPNPTPLVYRDCKDAFNKGMTESGVYTIRPDSLESFEVYCDQDTDGGGWAVFQRRQDGSVDFYRNWANYTAGFGDLSGEFWLGLDYINRLTSASSTELRVDLGDFENKTRYAKYNSFSVGDASTKYVLTVSGYSGTGGDSFISHSGSQFTTYDQDNEDWTGGSPWNSDNCAVAFKGAYWYHEGCHHSNLNGQYLRGTHSSRGDGVNWNAFRGFYYSLKFTEMKIRPSN